MSIRCRTRVLHLPKSTYDLFGLDKLSEALHDLEFAFKSHTAVSARFGHGVFVVCLVQANGFPLVRHEGVISACFGLQVALAEIVPEDGDVLCSCVALTTSAVSYVVAPPKLTDLMVCSPVPRGT